MPVTLPAAAAPTLLLAGTLAARAADLQEIRFHTNAATEKRFSKACRIQRAMSDIHERVRAATSRRILFLAQTTCKTLSSRAVPVTMARYSSLGAHAYEPDAHEWSADFRRRR